MTSCLKVRRWGEEDAPAVPSWNWKGNVVYKVTGILSPERDAQRNRYTNTHRYVYSNMAFAPTTQRGLVRRMEGHTGPGQIT